MLAAEVTGRGARQAGEELAEVGGFAEAQLVGEDGVRFYDAPGFPEEFKPYAIGQIQALGAHLTLGDDVTWTYLSPPPVHFAPGERTGCYRTSLDHPVTGEGGQARVSCEDYAVALVDEIEKPQHLNRRFTVGY